jgi:hypothetical protein
LKLELTKAALSGGKFTPGMPAKFSVEVLAMATTAVMNTIGARFLVADREGLIRPGWINIELETVVAKATVTHSIGSISQLQLKDVAVSKVFTRATKSTKKKAKRLLIGMRLEYSGNPIPLIEHWCKVGKGEGDMLIEVPTQTSLIDDGSKAGGKAVDMSKKPAKRPKKDEHLAFVDRTVAPPAWATLTRTYKDKELPREFSASMKVLDAAGGYKVEFKGKVSKIKIEPAVTKDCAAESEALQAAAQSIYATCQRWIVAGNEATKRHAGRMADWAAQFISPQALTDTVVEVEL